MVVRASSPGRAALILGLSAALVSAACSKSSNASPNNDGSVADVPVGTGTDASAGTSGSAGTTGAAGSGGVTGSAGTTGAAGGGGFDALPGTIPMFVAAGYRFRRMISCDDGRTWVADQMDTSSAASESVDDRGLGYGNGLFVASTGGGGDTAQIFSSTDGVVWTLRVPTGMYNGFSQVAYGNGIYVAGGGNTSIRSLTGVSGWGQESSMGNGGILRHLAFGNGKFAAVGGGRIQQSADALTWSNPTSGTCADPQDLFFGNGRFLAINSDGSTCLSADGGLTWTNGSVGGSSVQGFVFTGHDFLALGGGHVYRSTDGMTWTSAASSGGPRWLAASDKGTLVGVNGTTFYRSTDGVTWNDVTPTNAGTQNFIRLAFGYGSPSSTCPGP
jgi:hypothetical protein